jgi:biopolymer transport protein ExbD
MSLNPSSTFDTEPLVARKPVVEDAHFDITAMVDLVFMMNIFFLVTWVGAALAEIDLPTARHCVPADPDQCVLVTMLTDAAGQSPLVYVGAVRSTARSLDSPDMDELLRTAIEKDVQDSRSKPGAVAKDTLLIKAEKRIRLQDVARVAAAAQAIEGMKLNLAVVEKE